MPFLLSALIPILFTVVLGRFYCGWLCPAHLLYEISDKMGMFLRRSGFPVGRRRLDPRLKYLVLLPLQEGRNHLLLKISQGAGGWGFSFRLPDDVVRSSKNRYRVVE